MATIYRVRTDPYTFDSLILPLDVGGEAWLPQHGFQTCFDAVQAVRGYALGPRWRPLPVEHCDASVPKNRGEPVDFLSALSGKTAVSERALQAITPLVGAAIEPLPLDCEDEPDRHYFLLNFLDLVDCLDEEQSVVERGSEGYISVIWKYAFKPGTADGHHLFRLKQDPLGDTLASDEFKTLVEDHGLVGLKFFQVA